MSNNIYVIGHKSPDLDSVAGAISYANLKNVLLKSENYISAIAGKPNKETVFALEKFGFKIPELLENLEEKNIIMVDHNEFFQAAEGIEKANIIEVLDHHKVDFKYGTPISFRVLPIGSSCSIIAQMYFELGIEIKKEMASLMLSAILVDTVITKSPTCTEDDKNIIKKLLEIAEVKDYKEFGMELFKKRSDVKELSTKEIIKNDFKDFNFKKGLFGIGQIETVDLNDFDEKIDELLNELDNLKKEGNYHTVILFITDIIKEGSLFLIKTDDSSSVEKVLGGKLENNQIYIKDIISRKKQVTPLLSEVFDK